jgi:hypothetical protein
MPAFIIDMPGRKPIDITDDIKRDGVEKALKAGLKKALTPKKKKEKTNV